MQSVGEVAQKLATLLGPEYRAVPHDRFRTESSGWYVLRAGFRLPAHAFAKLYLEASGNELLAAYYIEKGLEHAAVGAPVTQMKLEMNDTWAWRRLAAQLTNGELERALLDGASSADAVALVFCSVDVPEGLAVLDIPNQYTRWRMEVSGRLQYEQGTPSPFVPQLQELERIADVVTAVATNTQSSWFWADLLLGSRIAAETSVSSVAALLRPFKPYL